MSTPPTLAHARLVPRGVLARVVLAVVGLAPLALTGGGVFELVAGSTTAGLVITSIGALLVGVVAFYFWREQTYRLWAGSDGVEVHELGLLGMRRTALRFDEIDEVYLKAVKASAGGGLVGALATAAVEAATDPADGGLNEHTTSIQVTLIGAGRKLTFTNGNKGVVAVYRQVLAQTRARLLGAALRRIQSGETVPFGPYGVARAGVRFGKELIAFDDVQDFLVENGTLRLKKKGAWFSKANPRLETIPNVDVLLACVATFRTHAPSGPSSATAAASGGAW